MTYPAPGAPDLADRLVGLDLPGGLATDPGRGLDHGAWTILMLMFPDADVPVAQLSVQPNRGFKHHWDLGRALRPLKDEGVLILCSGTLTHNLYDAFRRLGSEGEEPADYVRDFDQDIADLVERGDWDGLMAVHAWPSYRQSHPTDEHFLPLVVAAGAGDAKFGRTIHKSFRGPAMSMRSFAFD